MRYIALFLLCSVVGQAQYGMWRRLDNVSAYGYHSLLVLDDSSAYVSSTYGVFRSTDGGRFWSEIATHIEAEEIYSLVPEPLESPQALVLQAFFRHNGKGTAGLFSSINGGLTWDYRGGAVGNYGRYACPSGLRSYYMLCSHDNVVHIDRFGFIRKYIDDLPTSLLGTNARGIAAFDDNRALLYSLPGTVYVSGSGEAPWSQPWHSVNSGIENDEILHRFAEGNDVWAGTSASGVKHSMRPNFQWSASNSGLGKKGDPSMNVRRIFRDKRGPLVALTYDGFYSSSDGQHWNFVSNALPDWGRPDAAAIDNTGRYFLLYDSDSILVSEDEARNWVLRMDGLLMDQVRDIVIQTDTLFVAAAQCGFRSDADPGIYHEWHQNIDGLSERRIVAFTHLPGDTILAFDIDGKVSARFPGAASWTALSDDVRGDSVRCSHVSPNGIVIVGTHGGSVFASSDRGATWIRSQPVATATPVASVLAVSDSLWFVGTFGAGLQRSEDAGSSWSPVSGGVSHPMITALLRTADGDLFAGSFGGGLFRSSDNGHTWISLGPDSPAAYITSLVSNPANIVAVGSYDRGILFSRNDGASWTGMNTGLADTRVLRLLHDSRNNRLYAITYNGILNTHGMGLPTTLHETTAPADFTLHAAYPNPFHDRIEIDFELQNPRDIHITLVDMLGRNIARMEEQFQHPGRYRRTISAPSGASGVYLLSLESEGSRQQRVVMRLR